MPLLGEEESWPIAKILHVLGKEINPLYSQDAKHNIESLALMHIVVDFDELSIGVLNGLDLAYSHLSHAFKARATPITFEELFEQLHSFEAQMKVLVPSAPPILHPAIAFAILAGPSSHRRSTTRGGRNHARAHHSWTSGTPTTTDILLSSLCCLQLPIPNSSTIAT